ncbi:MAG: cell division protein ZapA [Oscillospiraceae bacterium]|jgi:cell division protein ZapA|nr:cell division protein ZapA [Oscillospiraceae bacterium]
MANRIKVFICNSEYSILSNEDPDYVRELASGLDNSVKDIMNKDSHISITQALVLCALSYLDDSNKSESNSDNLRTQIKDYLEDAASARSEVDSLRRDIAALKKENQQLKSQLLESGMPEGYRILSL